MEIFCSPKIKKQYRKKKICILAFAFLFVFLSILYLNLVVNPVVFHMSEVKVQSLVSFAMNNAVSEAIGNETIYDSLIRITRNDVGNVVMMQANTLEINKVSHNVIKLAQEKLEIVGQDGIDIPIGSFSGMPILAGRGPTVRLRILPVGYVSCSFSSEFIEKGINQTLHRIYLIVTANVGVVLPTENKKVSFSSDILIAECIIVGDVPETYLQSGTIDEMLNLVPD
ncbi:MAG: sporulation protein YunB [Clostridia bacterium]